jgi:hypothetical protein
MRMARVEFCRSTPKYIAMALMALAFVALGGFMVASADGEPFVVALGLVTMGFFGWAGVNAYRLAGTGVAYVFGDGGIEVRDAGLLIPWAEIRSWKVLLFRGNQRVIVLKLHRPDVVLGSLSPARRRLTRLGNLGGDWSLSFTGMTPGAHQAEYLLRGIVGE